MDQKKRKAEDNGCPEFITEGLAKLVDTFSKEQLLEIVKNALSGRADVLEEVRTIAEKDPAQRKIFVRGLGWGTSTEGLSSEFSKYGEIQEASVIMDKATGKSRGYGFVTFKGIDSVMAALQEPSKTIDGRVTVCQLAAQGTTPIHAAQDFAQRKIYVGNVPADLTGDKLLPLFTPYGDIEEGPLGYDKATGKSRGFALIIYKTVEGAKKALEEPVKTVDGHLLYCKLAAEGFKPKENADIRRVTAVQQLPVPQQTLLATALSGYSLPLGTATPTMLGSGLPLTQGINQGLGHGLLPTYLSSHVQGLSELGQSLNPSLTSLSYPFNSSLTPSLTSSLSSLSSQSLGHGMLVGLGAGHQPQSSSGLASLGPYSVDLGSYTGQLGAYSRLGMSLYGAAVDDAILQAGRLSGSSGASYSSALLAASQSQSDQSTGTVGSLRSSHYTL